MKNYISPGDTLDLTAPADGVVSGNPYRVGSILCFAGNSAAEGDLFPAKVRGVFTAPADTGSAWTEGQALDFTNGAFTPAADPATAQAAAAMARQPSAPAGFVYLPGRVA